MNPKGGKMTVTRFPYGLGLSIAKNFEAKSANVFAQADATPSVADGSLFYTNNTADTVITHFDSGEEGQVITVIFIDNSTKLANSGQLYLMGSGSLQGANNAVTLIQHNSAWHEIARSMNVSDITSYTSTGSAGNTITVDVRGRSVLLLNASGGAPINLQNLTNGEQGQEVTLVRQQSAVIITNSVNALQLANSANHIMAASGTMKFVKYGTPWYEVARSQNDSHVAVATPNSAGQNIEIGGKTMVYCDASGGAPITLARLIGGYQGQEVTIVSVNSTVLVINSAGTDTFVVAQSANNYAIHGSAALKFIKGPTEWQAIANV